MKVSHSNTLWLGYKLYSSFVLHGRITLLPLPTVPLGRHHSLQHPCYHYLADSCITYEPYTVLLIGKVLGGITDQHVVSRDALFFFLMFSFSRPSFISSIFRSLPLFSPSFCSFFHFLFVSFIISRSFILFIPSFPVLCILCSFLLSRCRLFLSFVHSFPFHGLSSPFIFHLFFLTLFLLFFLSYLLLLFRCFDHSLPLILSLFCYLFYLFFLSFVLSFVHSFFCSFVHSFLLPLHFSHSFFLSLSSLELSFVCSFIHSFIHSFILSLLDR